MERQQEADASPGIWSRYWQSGQQHSCFNDGKPLRTESYWTPFFDFLPAGSRLLDLACGAGALTRQAVAHPGKFSVTGADYAEGLPGIAGARIDAGVRLESLPYAAGSFDAVISQFGIEYSDLSASLGEVARVLAAGGKAAFLCHAAEGQAVAAAAERVRRLERVLKPGGPVAAVEAYGELLAVARVAPPDPQPVAEVFQSELSSSQDETTLWAIRFLAEIMTNAPRFEPAYLRDNVASVRRQLQGQYERLGLMTSAALGADAAAEFVRLASQAGLSLDRAKRVVDVGGSLAGWWLQGSRSA
jgi:ubiquinone/menaquinone biosynthesis C-methylase UbiE